MAETAMALFVLGIGATLIAELVTITARQQRGADLRIVATQEAANVLDELRRSPWDELTVERTARRTLSPLADETLPGGVLSVTIVDQDQSAAPAPARSPRIRRR